MVRDPSTVSWCSLGRGGITNSLVVFIGEGGHITNTVPQDLEGCRAHARSTRIISLRVFIIFNRNGFHSVFPPRTPAVPGGGRWVQHWLGSSLSSLSLEA